MPDWFLGPLCGLLLVGFIFFAFRQGFAVKPDKDKSGFGPTLDDKWIGTGRGSEDGHTL